MTLYKSSLPLIRIDQFMMEIGGGVIDRTEYMRIIARNADRPMEQIYRVKFLDDGEIEFYSFAMPQKNLSTQGRLNNVSLLPSWVKERLAILQICESGESVDGVGQKLSDKVYYVIE